MLVLSSTVYFPMKHIFFLCYYLYLIWFVWAGGLLGLTTKAGYNDFWAGLFVAWAGGMYLLPSMIGAHRGAGHSTRISMINVFLGWTGIGWLVALAMALFYRRAY